MIKTARKCGIANCNHPVVARELCAAHYKRWQRHGDTEQTRPADWGARQKHPLFKYWYSLYRRYARTDFCEGWKDFWVFAKDIGECPTDRHRLERIDASRPFGPDNCYWQLHEIKTTEEHRATRAAYQLRWWHANKDRARGADMLRKFGITLDDYNRMHSVQDGLCAICLEPEKAVDHKAKRTRQLAIDHCHTTGKVRDLLCGRCNTAIGAFRDRLDILERAVSYLKRHGSSEPPA